MRVHTRIFGTLHETLDVPLAGSGSGARVKFSGTLLFPGLRSGERLTRTATLPPRATILASDGTPLAEGPDRTSPIPGVAGQIVGTLGPIPSSQRAEYVAAGYPLHAQVGLDGLERIFQDQLAGTPGGTLRAGHRTLARATAVPAPAVTSTIDPKLESAAITAMAGRFAGIAAMDPRTGGLLALAGIAFSALQPPGSTMKMITATGALEAGIVKLSDVFPIQTSANIQGYTLSNAGGEACGGTFFNAFAVSCNSVFAPLGARLGGARLVNIAERFGFNQPSSIPGAAESTIPSASEIGDALAVGSSAIGQGKVQTTPLEMADVGATIAMGGRRPIPTLQAHQRPDLRARDQPPCGGGGAEDDDRGRAVRDRDRRPDPGGPSRGQDRDRRADRYRERRREHGSEHRRLVRRLRPGRNPRSSSGRCSPTRARGERPLHQPCTMCSSRG